MSESYKPTVWVAPIDTTNVDSKNTDTTSETTDSAADPVVPFFKTGVVSSASGSAYYQCGNTKVICAIYGPKPSLRSQSFDRGVIVCDVSFAPFAVQGAPRRRGRSSPEEQLLSSMLHDALSVTLQLQRFAKHEVQVLVQVLERDGEELAGAVNCASVALADAGLDMNDLAAAATVVRFSSIFSFL